MERMGDEKLAKRTDAQNVEGTENEKNGEKKQHIEKIGDC